MIRWLKNLFSKKPREVEHLIKRAHNPVIGYGKEESDGRVPVFVKRKESMARIRDLISDDSTAWTEDDIVPEKVRAGLFRKRRTSVVEVGDVKAQADRTKYRPLQAGSEISRLGSSSVGTAGALVKYYEFQGRPLVGGLSSFLRIARRFGALTEKVGVLSNSHVLNESVLDPQMSTSIVQPGLASKTSRIGEVLYTHPIFADKSNELDTGLASVDVDDVAEPDKNILMVGAVSSFRNPVADEDVHKYGRTTGYTQGDFLRSGVNITIDFGSDGHIFFEDVDMYTHMSSPGDSGSLIVSRDEPAGVGLLFAGSEVTTLAIPIEKVVSVLGIEPYS